jgi:aryl-alcohol dehydrogenase-like predicted oxidoreductase
MQYGRIPGLDKPIARLVQGTVMLTPDDLEYSFALLDDVFALGGTTFDTAHSYGGGAVERVLGQWMSERGVRDHVVIITKGAHPNEDRRRVTPFDIAADLHDSLARLKVETIDLYLLHRDDPTQPVGPIVDALNKHQRAGLIRAFGGSNWTHERIQAANAYAAANGLTGFAFSSPHFSLAEQIEEPWSECVSIAGPAGEGARAYYRESGMPLFTWSSMASGFFSGRFTSDNLATFTSPEEWLCVRCYCNEANFRRLDRARQLAAEKGFTLPQIALAYVLAQPFDVYALVGCRSRAEFAENLAALDCALTPEEVAWLDLREDVQPSE